MNVLVADKAARRPLWLRAALAGLLAAGAVGVLPGAAPAAGQAAGDAAAERQVLLLEQALEQAVRRSVTVVERRLPAPFPGLVFFAGPVQARGFVVDGYGLFFDVEYPVVRRSMLWSIGAFERLDGSMEQSLAHLRSNVLEMPPGPARAALERALEQLERLSPTPPPAAASPADTAVREDAAVPLSAADLEGFYRTALESAITDALLAYGGALPGGALGAGEWLTVAARDGRERTVRAGQRRTLQLRIRGEHLSALRAGRLSIADARARIEVHEQ